MLGVRATGSPGTLLPDFQKSDFRGILGAEITTRDLAVTETVTSYYLLFILVKITFSTSLTKYLANRR